MYETHFQLERRPFASVPNPDDYFPARAIETARESLVRLIDRGEGPGLVIGTVGTGKTLLCHLLADAFRDSYRVVVLPSGRLSTRRALLQGILYGLGLSFRELEENELRLSLVDHVSSRERCPHGMLLLVDEAENISLALFDELRSLTNLVAEGQPRVRIVLFGGPRAEEQFAHPRLESFNQRLAGRFYLEPFSAEETAHYIRSRVHACGGEPGTVFTDEALQVVYRATHGVPRLVNQLCDHALIMAAVGGCGRLEGWAIEEAWADLQQLPSPSTHRELHDHTSGDHVVEFGELEDLPSAEPAFTPRVAADDESRDHQPYDPVSAEEINAPQARDTNSSASIEDPPAITVPLYPQRASNPDRAGDPPLQGNIGSSPRRQPAQPGAPVSDAPADVELIFHGPHDPFGDGFDEEEVVLDRYTAPESMARRDQRRVTSDEGEEIAAQLEELLRQTSQATTLTTGPAAESDHNLTSVFSPAADETLASQPVEDPPSHSTETADHTPSPTSPASPDKPEPIDDLECHEQIVPAASRKLPLSEAIGGDTGWQVACEEHCLVSPEDMAEVLPLHCQVEETIVGAIDDAEAFTALEPSEPHDAASSADAEAVQTIPYQPTTARPQSTPAEVSPADHRARSAEAISPDSQDNRPRKYSRLFTKLRRSS